MKLSNQSILQNFVQTSQITVAIGLAFLLYPNFQFSKEEIIIPNQIENEATLLSDIANFAWAEKELYFLKADQKSYFPFA